MEYECRDCAISERINIRGLCVWCQADRDDRPYGTCSSCLGARAKDLTCACEPKPNPERRAQASEISFLRL